MAINNLIRERLERCANLPTLPSVALQVLELCQQDDLSLQQIARVISNDPALAAKLLRTANSPVFAVRREVTTLVNAINLLGANAVRTLVLSFSLSKQVVGDDGTAGRFWRRSVLAAMASRQMCSSTGLANPDEGFLAALLQDIGILALLRAANAQYAPLLAEAGADHELLADGEKERFGDDHAAVGAWLLTKWGVPAVLANVVGASHEKPIDLPAKADGLRNLAAIVAASGRFADLWTGDPATAAPRLFREITKRWPSGEINVDAINAHLVERAPEFAPLFEVRLDAAEMADVLEQAQETMVAVSVRATQELSDIHEALARLESRTATLLAEAQRDPLTGVANRGCINSYLDEVFQAAVSSNRLIGVIFADVDHFKSINDTYGHAAGDKILQSVALCITRAVRGGDFVGRYGGEEFVIVVRADALPDVMVVAERVRALIAETPHSYAGSRTCPVTASFGCALLDPGRHQSTSDLLEEADRCLYAAKRAGRNRCLGSEDKRAA